MTVSAAAELLRNANNVACLTGAGVSAECGVPTFRDADGLWRGFSPMELASPEGFAKNPVVVWEWYQWRRDLIRDISPNPGHFSFAEMEKKFAQMFLATQNVDGLHQLAGSTHMGELHGNIWIDRCQQCNAETNGREREAATEPKCVSCDGRLRPGVVWFGEALPMETFAKASRAAQTCDVFLVAGTSAVVYPAAGLIFDAKQNGAKVIEINPDTTDASNIADVSIRGKSGEMLPQILEKL